MHTENCTLHTAHCDSTLHTMKCRLHAAHCNLQHTINFTLYILQNVHYTLCNLHCKLSMANVQCTLKTSPAIFTLLLWSFLFSGLTVANPGSLMQSRSSISRTSPPAAPSSIMLWRLYPRRKSITSSTSSGTHLQPILTVLSSLVCYRHIL